MTSFWAPRTETGPMCIGRLRCETGPLKIGVELSSARMSMVSDPLPGPPTDVVPMVARSVEYLPERGTSTTYVPASAVRRSAFGTIWPLTVPEPVETLALGLSWFVAPKSTSGRPFRAWMARLRAKVGEDCDGREDNGRARRDGAASAVGVVVGHRRVNIRVAAPLDQGRRRRWHRRKPNWRVSVGAALRAQRLETTRNVSFPDHRSRVATSPMPAKTDTPARRASTDGDVSLIQRAVGTRQAACVAANREQSHRSLPNRIARTLQHVRTTGGSPPSRPSRSAASTRSRRCSSSPWRAPTSASASATVISRDSSCWPASPVVWSAPWRWLRSATVSTLPTRRLGIGSERPSVATFAGIPTITPGPVQAITLRRVDLALIERERLLKAPLPTQRGEFRFDAFFEFSLASNYWIEGNGGPGKAKTKVKNDIKKVVDRYLMDPAFCERGYVIVWEECDHKFRPGYAAQKEKQHSNLRVRFLRGWSGA